MPSITIKDVARAAQVSIATVSYVINNGPRPVSVQTRRRVLEAMEQLSFEPNASARRLRRQHNNVIGLAVAGLSGQPGIADLYFLDILRGISVAADHLGYDVMVFSNHHKLQDEEFFRSLARRHIVDGLIASGGLVNPLGLELLPAAGLPVVGVGRLQALRQVNRIEFDYQSGAYQLTQALLQRGHERIGLLLNSQAFPSETRRLQGYMQALQDADLEVLSSLIHKPAEIEFHPPFSAVQRLAENGATALITAPYADVCHALQKLGPAFAHLEVATLDFDDSIPRPANLHLGLRLEKYLAGQKAVELLLQSIQGSPDLPEVTTLSSRLDRFEEGS